MPVATAVEKKTAKKFKFRLLRGRHIETVGRTEGNKPITRVHQVERDPVTKLPICPIIETDHDLDKMFNVPGFAPKFERLYDDAKVPVDPTQRFPGETLQSYLARLASLQEQISMEITSKLASVDKMNKSELEDFAEQEEIDLAGAKTVDEMRKFIKSTLTGNEAE